MKLPFQGDVWVAASQVVPGNRAAVHHVLVTSMTLPPTAVIDAEGRMTLPQGASVDPAGRVSTAARAATPPPGAAAASPLGGFSAGWEPGVDAAISYGPGVAEHLTGTHLMFNLHYQANGKATTPLPPAVPQPRARRRPACAPAAFTLSNGAGSIPQ